MIGPNCQDLATSAQAPVLAAPRVANSRWAHVCLALCFLAWILPGLVGRDPWKADEAYSFGMVLEMQDPKGNPYPAMVKEIKDKVVVLDFNHPLAGWSSSDWMTAMVGEVGEAANVVKKLNRVRDGVPGNKVSADELRAQLRRELGDVFVYLDLMCQSLGFSVADAAAEVFNSKSAEIGYPKTL